MNRMLERIHLGHRAGGGSPRLAHGGCRACFASDAVRPEPYGQEARTAARARTSGCAKAAACASRKPASTCWRWPTACCRNLRTPRSACTSSPAGSAALCASAWSATPAISGCLRWCRPISRSWPDVDVDVIQKFQFGGIGALFGYEIDLLVTPDPLYKPGCGFRARVRLRAGAGRGPAPSAAQRCMRLAGSARRRGPDHLSRGRGSARRLQPVPDARRRYTQAPQDDRDDRHHAADGGERARRGGAAALARGRVRG